MANGKTALYFGGVPTDAEVNRLLKAWPTLTPGTKITYLEIAQITGCTPKTNRFMTVIGTWRRKLAADNIWLQAVRGEGFTVCTANEVVDVSSGKFRAAGRQIRRSHIMAVSAADDDLDAPHKVRRDWQVKTSAVLMTEIATNQKQLVVELKKANQLPRPQ